MLSTGQRQRSLRARRTADWPSATYVLARRVELKNVVRAGRVRVGGERVQEGEGEWVL